jgi:hypothetical protein
MKEWSERNARRRKRGRDERPPPDDTCILKLNNRMSRVEWCTRFRNTNLDVFLRPDRKLLVRRGDDLFFVSPDGRVDQGPKLDIARGNMAVDPRTGDMYFGGSYRSATGLEPYVNPYLYKVDANGKQVWTAWGWSGPICGVEQFRLVSDSSVTRINVAADGSLTLVAWSDGGNTVVSHQPYDMRIPTKVSGFCSSTWGAAGGITVRIAHIIHMDQDTMEIDYSTKYIGYRPAADMPTLLNIYDMTRTDYGEVAVTGGCWNAFVETQDAWTTPWWVESRTDKHAKTKGGPFFTLFREDFSTPRMATIMPGVCGLQLATKGRYVLMYGGATGRRRPDDPRWTRRHYDIHLKNAIQPTRGGDVDGYLCLVDTQGKPNPPEIPEKTWGKKRKRGRR